VRQLAWLNTPVGQVIRDIIEGGIAGAIAVARRKLVGSDLPPPTSPPQ
jgi:hypothetical protein